MKRGNAAGSNGLIGKERGGVWDITTVERRTMATHMSERASAVAGHWMVRRALRVGAAAGVAFAAHVLGTVHHNAEAWQQGGNVAAGPQGISSLCATTYPEHVALTPSTVQALEAGTADEWNGTMGRATNAVHVGNTLNGLVGPDLTLTIDYVPTGKAAAQAEAQALTHAGADNGVEVMTTFLEANDDQVSVTGVTAYSTCPPGQTGGEYSA